MEYAICVHVEGRKWRVYCKGNMQSMRNGIKNLRKWHDFTYCLAFTDKAIDEFMTL